MAAPVHAPALPRFVELVRVSSTGQAARDTPADQRAALDRLRLHRPGRLVERIEGQISGAAAGVDRPDLLRLAELAAVRGFDEVRVRHLDRLTRHDDMVERAAVLSMVRRAGAVIVDAGGSVLDPTTMGGELTWVVSTLASAEERRKILERTMAAKRRLAAEGRLVSSKPPWGRTFDKATGTWGVDREALATYRRLFDLVLRGRSLRQIVEQLNGEGVTTSTGRPWTAGTVYNAVTAPHVAGRWRSHGAEAQIPPVVDEATQAAALARLKANDITGGRRDVHPALLRKLATCGACGSPLYTDRGGGHTYYYCKPRGACAGRHRADVVDEAVRGAVETWLGRPGALAAAAAQDLPDDTRSAKEDAAEAARELRDLDRQEERLARLSRKGMLSAKVQASQLAEVARLRAAAERRAEDAQSRLKTAARRVELAGEVEERVGQLRKGLGRAGFAEWRELVEILFPPRSIAVWPTGRIELRGTLPLDDLGEETLRRAGRDLSPRSRRSGQIPVRLDAVVGRKRWAR
jgi:DNA invertase Pin-like site-specific DNA recombinase